MKGWFDAFRSDGGPTLYNYSNRTSVSGDVQIITLYLIFFTIFFAFLVIFPGVRKEKFTTFTSVTLSLFVGTVILVTKCGSGWHVGKAEIVSSYRAFSREKIVANLGAYIGLGHVNITLTGLRGGNWSDDVDFNERFSWSVAGEMTDAYKESLVRGLPFPILTVAEYLSLGQEGFSWGVQYRQAGYYGNVMLWAALASWLMMNLLLVVVPRYGAYAMIVTGGCMWGSGTAYYTLLPVNPLVLRFEERMVTFRLGWCFYLVVVAGSLCVLVGTVVTIVDLISPNTFSTILEVDYDTPYDRHIIIEESHHTRNKKKTNSSPNRLEEPAGASFGTRLLRRISSKKLETLAERHGLDNTGFEMDPPKSPWRYPFQRGGTGGNSGLRMGFGGRKGTARPAGMGLFQRQDSSSSSVVGTPVRQSARQLQPLAARPAGMGLFQRQDSSSSSVVGAPARQSARPLQPLPARPAGMGLFQRQDSASSSCTGSSHGSSLGLSFLQREPPTVLSDPAVNGSFRRTTTTNPSGTDLKAEVAMW